MDRKSAFRLATLLALAVGLTGMGPGSCGPLPDPCEDLDEQDCLETEGCAPVYFQPQCACANCAEGYDCQPCECGVREFAACEEQQPPPPPQDRCEGLTEDACYAEPGCEPVYYGGEPGTRCADDSRCLGGYAGCVEAPRPPPPPPCELLEERACQARPDCEPLYGPDVQPACEVDPDDPTVGCVGGGFVECRPVVCEPLSCRMDCPAGLAVDERGCNICECNPGCFADSDCADGERCELPLIDCPENAGCAMPVGRCVADQRTCSTDHECLPGESCVFPEYDCPPNTYCGAPLGTCQPTEPRPCAADSDCGRGEVCRADPNDPCSQTDVFCFAPAQTICLPACELLDERSCLSRPDCIGAWGSACGEEGCTPDRVFRCEDATAVCPDMFCDLYCPNGFQRDARGCEICACLPDEGCRSDADCAAGEYCALDMTNCDPAGNCGPSTGVCRPFGCLVNEDCPGDMVCLVPPSPCDDGDYCESSGTCAPAGSCLSDADCAAGESCMFLMYDCVGEGCSPGYGTCNAVEPGCASDADCATGERCELLDCDPATGIDCSPYGVCVPAECQSDADCAPGQVCEAVATCTSTDCPPAPPAICVDRDPTPCAGLDEQTCLDRPDCSATYVPSDDSWCDGWCMAFAACVDL